MAQLVAASHGHAYIAIALFRMHSGRRGLELHRCRSLTRHAALSCHSMDRRAALPVAVPRPQAVVDEFVFQDEWGGPRGLGDRVLLFLGDPLQQVRPHPPLLPFRAPALLQAGCTRCYASAWPYSLHVPTPLGRDDGAVQGLHCSQRGLHAAGAACFTSAIMHVIQRCRPMRASLQACWSGAGA